MTGIILDVTKKESTGSRTRSTKQYPNYFKITISDNESNKIYVAFKMLDFFDGNHTAYIGSHVSFYVEEVIYDGKLVPHITDLRLESV